MIGLMLAAAAALLPVQATPRRAAPSAPAKPATVELWVLDQISFPTGQDAASAAVLKALEPDHTMEAVATRLALLSVKFERTIVTIDTSKMPPALLAQLKTLPATEPFAIPAGARMTINGILAKRNAPVGPSGPAAPAPAPSPSPAAAAGIDRLLDLMNVAAQFDTQVTRIVDAMLPAMVQGNTNRADEVRKIVGEELRASFTKSRPLLLARARELYLARYSADELNQLAAFYDSPVGRKMTSMSPGIAAEMAQFGQQIGRAASTEAQPRILQRLRAANLNPPVGV